MKKYVAIVVLLSFLYGDKVFAQPQVPYNIPAPSVSHSTWKPYKFKGTEHFKYEVKGINESGVKTGIEVIDIQKTGSKYRVKIRGKYGENEGEFSTTVNSTDEIAGAIMAQSIFNPYLAPLAVALFSPAWTVYFAFGMNLEEGSSMKTKDENGNIVEITVSGGATYAGKKGKKLTVKENGKEIWAIVWSEEVPLPLYIKMGEKGEDVYELKLVEFKE